MVVLIFKKDVCISGNITPFFALLLLKTLTNHVYYIDTSAIINADKSVRMYAMKGC